MLAAPVEARYLEQAGDRAEPGMMTCQVRISASKKTPRIRLSELSSLKTPVPGTLARMIPTPARSSRQRPADSALVTSTASALSASRRVRKPATVTKLPVPSSSLRRRSLPFCADIAFP
jgi:hypothetical protein